MKSFVSKATTPDGRIKAGETYYGNFVTFLGDTSRGRVLIIDDKDEPMTFAPEAFEKGKEVKPGALPVPPKTGNVCFRELAKQAHATALEKGWWAVDREAGTLHMLMVSEIAEATEEARKGTPPIYTVSRYDNDDPPPLISTPADPDFSTKKKPEGELIELADAVIRIMDYTESRGWDLEAAIKLKMEYNKSRSHRHGGKQF